MDMPRLTAQERLKYIPITLISKLLNSAKKLTMYPILFMWIGWVNIYIHQLCTDTGCSLKDLPGEMGNETDGKRYSGNPMLSVRPDDDDEWFVN